VEIFHKSCTGDVLMNCIVSIYAVRIIRLIVVESPWLSLYQFRLIEIEYVVGTWFGRFGCIQRENCTIVWWLQDFWSQWHSYPCSLLNQVIFTFAHSYVYPIHYVHSKIILPITAALVLWFSKNYFSESLFVYILHTVPVEEILYVVWFLTELQMFAWCLRFLGGIFSDWSFVPIIKESRYRLLNLLFARYLMSTSDVSVCLSVACHLFFSFLKISFNVQLYVMQCMLLLWHFRLTVAVTISSVCLSNVCFVEKWKTLPLVCQFINKHWHMSLLLISKLVTLNAVSVTKM